ncbi:MAG: 2Fe-2S iron-sulfur cluster-binding protein [Bacteriovorax sp.]
MPTVLVKALSPNERDQKIEVEEGRILFDELERQGLILPHGCLAGSCGSCRIEILEGAENLTQPGAVESDTILHLAKQNYSGLNKIIRLSCRAKVLGDVTIAILR